MGFTHPFSMCWNLEHWNTGTLEHWYRRWLSGCGPSRLVRFRPMRDIGTLKPFVLCWSGITSANESALDLCRSWILRRLTAALTPVSCATRTPSLLPLCVLCACDRSFNNIFLLWPFAFTYLLCLLCTLFFLKEGGFFPQKHCEYFIVLSFNHDKGTFHV